jgi:Putative Actinobacterial Holin-X, holin superfamily III
VALAGSSNGRAGGRRSTPDSPTELYDLVVDYVKQETLTPLRGLGRFLTYGITGSVVLALGVVLLLLSILRVLQTETGAFHGNLSWIPYLIVAVLAAGVLGLAGWRIAKGQAAREAPTPEQGGR